jgi:hypothetical protein
MAWHDKTPWTVRRDQEQTVMRSIRSVVDAFDHGQVSFRKATAQIEELLNGDAARVIRVGHKTHQPEIES